MAMALRLSWRLFSPVSFFRTSRHAQRLLCRVVRCDVLSGGSDVCAQMMKLLVLLALAAVASAKMDRNTIKIRPMGTTPNPANPMSHFEVRSHLFFCACV
jgi:hypothetical protein